MDGENNISTNCVHPDWIASCERSTKTFHVSATIFIAIFGAEKISAMNLNLARVRLIFYLDLKPEIGRIFNINEQITREAILKNFDDSRIVELFFFYCTRALNR